MEKVTEKDEDIILLEKERDKYRYLKSYCEKEIELIDKKIELKKEEKTLDKNFSLVQELTKLNKGKDDTGLKHSRSVVMKCCVNNLKIIKRRRIDISNLTAITNKFNKKKLIKSIEE